MDKTPTWVWVLGAVGIGALVAKFVLKPAAPPAAALGRRQQQAQYTAAPPPPATSSAPEGTLQRIFDFGLSILPKLEGALPTDYSQDNLTSGNE